MSSIRWCTNVAHKLMKRHGLTERGWKFGYDRAKSRCGVCDYNNRTIKLSSYYVKDMSGNLGDIRNTILHEIAHAIAGYDAAHNECWKRVAVSIGCTGTTCNTVWKGASAKYKVWCNCKKVDVLRYRLSKKIKSCVCASCRTMNIRRV